MRLAIFGSNDLARLIAHHAVNDKRWEIAGFFDNKKERGTEVAGFGRVLGGADILPEVFSAGTFDALLLGIGYTQFPYRKKVYEELAAKVPFANLIHSSCYVDTSVRLGTGVVLLPGCVVDCHVAIDDNVLMNTGCVVAHDSRLGRHSFLGPGVKIAGEVVIEECNFIGTGSTIIDHVTIAPRSLIGGGSVVVRTIEESGTYVGVPAKRINDNKYFRT